MNKSTTKSIDAWQILRIQSEFTRAFDEMSDLGPCISIFGSARTKPDDKYYNEAIKLSKLIVKSGYGVITGGGPGIMEAANVGAYDKLIKDHSSSSYADQGTLLMAKYLFDAGNYSLALDALKPLTTRENSVIASTAILRSASLHLELGQHEEALSVLNIENVEGFSGLFYNLAGDVFLDLGNIEEAKKNYTLAIDNITENSSLTQLIQIKLDDLS